jgi:hypothetical protein
MSRKERSMRGAPEAAHRIDRMIRKVETGRF